MRLSDKQAKYPNGNRWLGERLGLIVNDSRDLETSPTTFIPVLG